MKRLMIKLNKHGSKEENFKNDSGRKLSTLKSGDLQRTNKSAPALEGFSWQPGLGSKDIEDISESTTFPYSNSRAV